MHRGPGPQVPPGTIVHRQTVLVQPAGAPAAVVVVAPPPPPPVVVGSAPVPHGVRIVHHSGHAHKPGLPKLVGIQKPPHKHHARVMQVGHPPAAILPGHAAHSAAQPSLKAMTVHQVPVAQGVPTGHVVQVTQAGHIAHVTPATPSSVVPSSATRIVHKK